MSFSWEQRFWLAAEKDDGFTRELFLEAIVAFGRLDPYEVRAASC